LRRFIAAGADLVSFSGGKAIGGPQASGILCGRKHLIQSVSLQQQDLDVPPLVWRMRGHAEPLPHHGIGRSMKVGKEEIVGLIAALRAYVARDHAADRERWRAQLDCIAEALRPIETRPFENAGGVPLLRVELGSAERAARVLMALERGDPRVALAHGAIPNGALIVNPLVLQPGEGGVVARQLKAVLESEA
jgi:L-seryl-tRNA(Ser) seleniumtransferase